MQQPYSEEDAHFMQCPAFESSPNNFALRWWIIYKGRSQALNELLASKGIDFYKIIETFMAIYALGELNAPLQNIWAILLVVCLK